MESYRFHIPAMMHLPVSEKYMACAFTQKIVKLSKMLMSLGHEVYIYGPEGSDVPCTEFIQTHTLEDIRQSFGTGHHSELGYDWEQGGFDEASAWERAKYLLYPKFIQACITEINSRKRETDFLLVMQGVYHRPIEQAVGLKLSVEPGIGYLGSYLPYRAFESACLMNFTYGGEVGKHMIRPNVMNRVIPNYFDDKDFDYKEKKQGFFLFIGRVIYAKGITIAVKTADALNKKLLIAGQGVHSWDREAGRLVGKQFDVTSPNIEYLGYAPPSLRRKLMADAEAVFVPSLYLEPFGGVNVEAQLSGTPVIATNFGVFPETVKHGETGFLCNTNEDFIKAAKAAKDLDPKKIRKHAERYLMDNVKYEYQEWFDLIYQTVFGDRSLLAT